MSPISSFLSASASCLELRCQPRLLLLAGTGTHHSLEARRQQAVQHSEVGSQGWASGCDLGFAPGLREWGKRRRRQGLPSVCLWNARGRRALQRVVPSVQSPNVSCGAPAPAPAPVLPTGPPGSHLQQDLLDCKVEQQRAAMLCAEVVHKPPPACSSSGGGGSVGATGSAAGAGCCRAQLSAAHTGAQSRAQQPRVQSTEQLL